MYLISEVVIDCVQSENWFVIFLHISWYMSLISAIFNFCQLFDVVDVTYARWFLFCSCRFLLLHEYCFYTQLRTMIWSKMKLIETIDINRKYIINRNLRKSFIGNMLIIFEKWVIYFYRSLKNDYKRKEVYCVQKRSLQHMD